MSKQDMNVINPSGQSGGKPSGKKTRINPISSKLTQRKLILENHSAMILANYGYKIEQNPPAFGGKEPDYRIEGQIFDCYAPSSSNPDRIRNSISKKVREEQTERIVLNLDDSKIMFEELRNVLDRRPINNLKEIIVVKDEKVVLFFP